MVSVNSFSDLGNSSLDNFGHQCFDDIIDDDQRIRINNYLRRSGWKFGWRSNEKSDYFRFWHKHFAGSINHNEPTYDCSEELKSNSDIIHQLWCIISSNILLRHRLVRCYANGMTYGDDGTTHRDATLPNNYTAIYYPHKVWEPDWGGETVFFNKMKTDIVASVYPKSNRLVVFDGTTPHVARGVSRTCPVFRVTLMFKTEKINC